MTQLIPCTLRYRLDRDVILSENTSLQVTECLARLRFHRTIYVDWNFAAADPMGLCTVINFYGPPGTGKTIAAEAIAGQLGLKFLQIALPQEEAV